MSDNSTDLERLIRYLDGELSPEESADLETSISSNPSLEETLGNIRAVRGSLRRYGLNQQVSRVRLEMLQQRSAPRRFLLPATALRIAAVFLLAMAIAGIYWYTRLTPEHLYANNFQPLVINATRGADDNPNLESAWQQKDPATVITLFNRLAAPSPKDRLLAANAWLTLGQPKPAIKNLLTLQADNTLHQRHEFQDDIDYYLAMSYLADHQLTLALPLFQKIHDSKDHLYHDKVDTWFLRKLHWAH